MVGLLLQLLHWIREEIALRGSATRHRSGSSDGDCSCRCRHHTDGVNSLGHRDSTRVDERKPTDCKTALQWRSERDEIAQTSHLAEPDDVVAADWT